ncbi:hypothetical protein [Paraburkholderia sp. J12]|nr:hypothetical protein [Paraburkholderia sp. J12]
MEPKAAGLVAGDAVAYPADDLVAARQADRSWGFAHKDGRPY